MENKKFVKGALILIVFNIIGKIVGAVYKIPLANILGPVGIGKYQLVFPLFALLLAVSTSGVPVAISKLVAEYNSNRQFGDARKLIKLAIFYLFLLSMVCMAVVVIFAKPISNLQGNSDIYVCYYSIAPAVLFVGLISVFRGYFQGNLMMLPTAISNLTEQVGKLIFGLYFVNKLIGKGVVFGVVGAILGIVVSEFISLLFLFFYYIFYRRKHKQMYVLSLSRKDISKRLFSTAVPITLGGIVAPITSIIDSLLVVNILIFTGFSSAKATALLGIQAGIVEPIINIPIIIAVSISASLLPNITKAFIEKKVEEIKQLIEKAFQITLSVSFACAICFVIFGKQIFVFLYGNVLRDSEINIASKLLFIGGINLTLLSLVQVSAGILHGMGKQKLTAKTMVVGCLAKIALTFVLVSVKQINIYGAMVSGAISYFIVFVINYGEIKKHNSARIYKILYNISIQECFVCLFAFFSNYLFKISFGGNIALIVGGFTAIVIFLVTYYVLFLIDKSNKIIST